MRAAYVDVTAARFKTRQPIISDATSQLGDRCLYQTGQQPQYKVNASPPPSTATLFNYLLQLLECPANDQSWSRTICSRCSTRFAQAKSQGIICKLFRHILFTFVPRTSQQQDNLVAAAWIMRLNSGQADHMKMLLFGGGVPDNPLGKSIQLIATF